MPGQPVEFDERTGIDQRGDAFPGGAATPSLLTSGRGSAPVAFGFSDPEPQLVDLVRGGCMRFSRVGIHANQYSAAGLDLRS